MEGQYRSALVRPVPPPGYKFDDSDIDSDDDIEIIDGNTTVAASSDGISNTISGLAHDSSTESDSEDLDEDLFGNEVKSPFDIAGKSLFGSDGYSTDESEDSVESLEGGEGIVDEIVDELLKACEGKGNGHDDKGKTRVSEDVREDTRYTVSAGSLCSEDETDDESSNSDSSVTLGDTDSFTEDSDERDYTTDSSQSEAEDETPSADGIAGADFIGAGMTATVNRPLKRQMDIEDMAYEDSRELKRLRGDHPALRTSTSQGTVPRSTHSHISLLTDTNHLKPKTTSKLSRPWVTDRSYERTIILRTRYLATSPATSTGLSCSG